MAFCVLVALCQAACFTAPGEWPEPRQNPCLTAVQPLPGGMAAEPKILARYDLGRVSPSVTRVGDGNGGEVGLAIVGGALHAFTPDGGEKWNSHPPGLNFLSITAAEDLDGDGSTEVLLQAGRPAAPYGAAVLVDLASGAVRWRYDVEPMSYAWYLYADGYLPDTPGKQILVLMQGYPPDEKNGYIALFDVDAKENGWACRWRYDFDKYTCFPSLLRTDYDGDGMRELVVETHSRMWFLDPATGTMEHFEGWDVAPANVRSYGLTEFTDLDGDGLEDFLCIADFAQHHEVLLNRKGRFERAWLQAWGESVTTGKVDAAYPKPAHGDVDGDGAIEVVVGVFNGEGENAWALRVYNAVDGRLEYKSPGIVPVTLADVDGDGVADIVGNRVNTANTSLVAGACVIGFRDGEWAEKWNRDHAHFTTTAQGEPPRFEQEGTTKILHPSEDGGITETVWQAPAAAPKPGFEKIPAIAAAEPAPLLLLADLGRKGSELLLQGNGRVCLLQWNGDGLSPVGEVASLCPPVIADLDQDGKVELIRAQLTGEDKPLVEALTPALDDRILWQTVLPPPDSPGLPNGQAAYLRSGRFTGKAAPDLYAWFGAPHVRSVCLEGTSGRLVWEQANHPEIERHWGPSINLASVQDVDGDAAEDLVFTNPDYYCVASGRTGDALLGPLFPPDIFKQPSQGLYTLPALLARPGTEPLVCLCDGHYFQAVMTLHAEPRWYALPKPGESPTGAEAFLPLGNGTWLLGFGRQDGGFRAIDVETGAVRWELPVEATCSEVITCDVDGDGRYEFVFTTSHGDLWAIGDEAGASRVAWHATLGAPAAGAPIAGDINRDGKSEIMTALANGTLLIFGS